MKNEKFFIVAPHPLHVRQRHLLHPLRRKRPPAAVRGHLRPAPPGSGVLAVEGAERVGESRAAGGALCAVREDGAGVREETV